MNILRNHVQLIGHLGKNPEIKKFENDKTVANFTIATNENYTNSNGEKAEDTQWHNVVAWNNLANIAESILTKGKQVAIDGRLVYRSYDDKEGNKRHITEIVANEILILDKKSVDL